MLSSLLPQLREKGVPLYGVLHEARGAGKFGTFLKGDLFLDKEVGLHTVCKDICLIHTK